MAELADAADSKSAGLRPLGVRLPLPAPALSLSPRHHPATPAHLTSLEGYLDGVAGRRVLKVSVITRRSAGIRAGSARRDHNRRQAKAVFGAC